MRFFSFFLKNCIWTSSDAAFLFCGVLLYFADIETNECLENNGGCWLDKATNVSACKVQFYIFCGVCGGGGACYLIHHCS